MRSYATSLKTSGDGSISTALSNDATALSFWSAFRYARPSATCAGGQFGVQIAALDRRLDAVLGVLDLLEGLADLVATCKPATRIAVAVDLTSPREWIRMRRIDEWRREPGAIGKRPAIYLLQA